MCRDFDSKQTECGVSLARFYLGRGLLHKAVAELELVLKSDNTERLAVNHYKGWDCDVPTFVIEVWDHKVEQSPNAADAILDAKFILLLVGTR